MYSTAGSITTTISHNTGNTAAQPTSGSVGQRSPLIYVESVEGGNSSAFAELVGSPTSQNPISDIHKGNSPRNCPVPVRPGIIYGISPYDIATTEDPLDKAKQLRRRAQNRAAQRAFRERKERYAADLEQRAKDTEARWNSLQQENERLRSAIVSLQGAISALWSQTVTPQGDSSCESPTCVVAISRDMSMGENDQLLSFTAAWNLIQGHPSVKNGRVDLQVVWDRLRGCAIRQSSGYMFTRLMVEMALDVNIQ